MKVIFSNNLPFSLAHGGTQTLLESLMIELRVLGVEVEPERWWDQTQTGDVLHFMNRPNALNVSLAKQKGFKVVMTENLDQTASRSQAKLFLQKWLTKIGSRAMPRLTSRMNWNVYRELDAMIYVVNHEWQVAQYLFNAPPERGHIIPHGLNPEVMTELGRPQQEEDYLVSMATIHPRKNTVLLAEAAKVAATPVVFLGKPYSPDDEYFLKFQKLVDNKFVRYRGFVLEEEKQKILRGARGFALLSEMESGCIALYEAAAAGLPLFLSDLPWARKVYAHARNVQFVTLASPNKVAHALKKFYRTAHRVKGTSFPILTWREVAKKYVEVYDRISKQN